MNLLKIVLASEIIFVGVLMLTYYRKKKLAENERLIQSSRILRGEQDVVMGKEVRGLSYSRGKMAKQELKIKKYQGSMSIAGVIMTVSAILLAGIEIYDVLAVSHN